MRHKCDISDDVIFTIFFFSKETPQTDEETEQQIEDEQSQRMATLSTKQTLLIFFSAGTTGLIKAVEVSHKSLIVNIQQISCPIYAPPTNKERFLLSRFYRNYYLILTRFLNKCSCLLKSFDVWRVNEIDIS